MPAASSTEAVDSTNNTPTPSEPWQLLEQGRGIGAAGAHGGGANPVHALRGYWTDSVTAAVWSRPPVWNCTNNRQFPGVGSFASKDSVGPP